MHVTKLANTGFFAGAVTDVTTKDGEITFSKRLSSVGGLIKSFIPSLGIN